MATPARGPPGGNVRRCERRDLRVPLQRESTSCGESATIHAVCVPNRLDQLGPRARPPRASSAASRSSISARGTPRPSRRGRESAPVRARSRAAARRPHPRRWRRRSSPSSSPSSVSSYLRCLPCPPGRAGRLVSSVTLRLVPELGQTARDPAGDRALRDPERLGDHPVALSRAKKRSRICWHSPRAWRAPRARSSLSRRAVDPRPRLSQPAPASSVGLTRAPGASGRRRGAGSTGPARAGSRRRRAACRGSRRCGRRPPGKRPRRRPPRGGSPGRDREM